jgi:hypothetical protein
MRFERAIAVIAIAAVLLCPFVCFSRTCRAQGTQKPVCSCCDHAAEVDSPAAPAVPDSPRRDGDCVCQGAVFLSKGASLTAEKDEVNRLAAPPQMMHSPLSTTPSAGSRGWEQRLEFSLRSSGRGIRTLIASLLL